MKLKYNFVVQEVAGLYMAVAVGDKANEFSGVINLNDTAKFIFELIQQGLSEDEIISRLMVEYEGEPGDETTFQQALDNLKEQLKEVLE